MSHYKLSSPVYLPHEATMVITTSYPGSFFGKDPNLVPRAMPVRGLGWHWLWGN